MNKEEAKIIYEKISNKLKLHFTSYYKYSFNFKGIIDDIEINVSYGGSADDIYKYDVDNNPIEVPKNFDDLLNQYNFIEIKKGTDIFTYYNY